MLHFGKFNDKFDIHISGLGLDMYVDDVKNTVLKGPLVGKNIPTVAEVRNGKIACPSSCTIRSEECAW